jgi:hypothetical protein
MIGNYFRPWGELNWLIPKLPQVKWDLIGCLSAEDRFIGTLSSLEKSNQINQSLFFKVIDPPSKETLAIESKLLTNQTLLESATSSSILIEDHDLLEPYKNIVDSVNRFLAKSDGNIIVDISAFPKRFFFPIIKRLMQGNLKNLIVTYTTPEKYCSDELSGNPHSWDHLPLFMPVEVPEPQIDVAIVGVGFMPFALPELLLSTYNATPVKFLFPFPPGPPNYQRTWDFMRKIEKSFTFKPLDSIIRLDSNNMPDAFEYITQETDAGNKNPLFAPYGPKPISLAMCIYATLKDSPVYYTQPTHYHPEYSSGIKNTYGYSVILDGKKLYSV